LPVIASGVGGLADFCVDRENALLHEPHSPASLAKAIGRLLVDPALRAKLAAAGRRTAEERFELNGLLDRYARMIESVAQDRR
jgi:D-inositol-3-phosphate glycosyltransferase